MVVMIVLLLIVMVLFGLAYADYCLVDNTEHFGICFAKVAEAEEARKAAASSEAVASIEAVADSDMGDVAANEVVITAEARPAAQLADNGSERLLRSPLSPVPAWLFLELEPVLELREQAS
jgi:hypothetical protein